MIQIAVKNNCIKCGRCVSVCPAYIFQQEAILSKIKLCNVEYCIDCGQCVAICPTSSVIHSSYPLSTVHKIRKDMLPSPESLMELLKSRRSNRAISKKPIADDKLKMVLDAANYAPTAGNSQGLEYTLVSNQETIAELAEVTIAVVENLIAYIKENGNEEERKGLIYFQKVLEKHREGKDILLRSASSLIFIHSKSKMNEPDANLAYQNASLMAESLGLAHYYMGYIRIFSSYDSQNMMTKLLGIDGIIHAGMGLGMPEYEFNNYMDRKEQIVKRLS